MSNFLHIFIFISTLTLYFDKVLSTNQAELFEEFANKSWKSTKITIINDAQTIERHIVNNFNTKEWAAKGGDKKKINRAVNQKIKDYYDENLEDPNHKPYKYDPSNPTMWNQLRNSDLDIDLAADDSPRRWMQKLNLREIFRFKEFIGQNPQLISNANYATDDLVKARSLCGIFWVVSLTGTKLAYKAFCGMLFPGQALRATRYKVHTCMHGFSFGNDKNDVAYYFVPYGITASGTKNMINGKDDPCYVAKIGFKVIAVCSQMLGRFISDVYFEKSVSLSQSNNTTISTLYSQDDYAEAIVEGKTQNNKTLYELLKDYSNNPIGNDIIQSENKLNQIIKLPEFGSNTFVNKCNIKNANRLFVIGFNSKRADLDYCISVSTALINTDVENNPRRSIDDDENEKLPTNIQNRYSEYSSSIATFPGMSGGPVLECRLDRDSYSKEVYRFLGTVFGAERQFSSDNKIEKFANFINKVN